MSIYRSTECFIKENVLLAQPPMSCYIGDTTCSVQYRKLYFVQWLISHKCLLKRSAFFLIVFSFLYCLNFMLYLLKPVTKYLDFPFQIYEKMDYPYQMCTDNKHHVL